MVIRTGATGSTAGSGFGRGVSIFTACRCGGMVTINMISNTSMTSISGVVLISEVG